MFDKKYEDRLIEWVLFRQNLETASDPIQDVIDCYRNAPLVNIQVDPYDSATWPTPWELIHENQYCDFSKILAICYTLQLTERFSDRIFEIHITHDEERSAADYLLYIDDQVVGFIGDKYVHRNQVPKTTISECTYVMPQLN